MVKDKSKTLLQTKIGKENIIKNDHGRNQVGNGKVLVSHAYNSQKLNKTLYLTFSDKLYLINEFGSKDDKVIKKLKSENKFLSTETPLYYPYREMIYQCAKTSPLREDDIKHLYTILPNALQCVF